jgi:DHA1 family tetracycline resistance protein-like MFS transporter
LPLRGNPGIGARNEAVTQRQPGKHALLFIFMTILIDTMGFGIVMPVMPQLVMELTGQSIDQATLPAGLLIATYAVLQFLCGPLMGNLADRYGRRPILLISLAAFAINYMVMGFAPTLAWLFVGRVVSGIAGAVHSPANAYVADVTPPEKRAGAFGFVGAAFGVGFVVGPAIGGLLGELGPRAPFFAAAALGAINFFYGLFVLPESLPPERRRKFEWARANPLGALISLRRYPRLVALGGGVFLWQIAQQVYPSTWPFFAKIRFDWSEAAIGASLAFVGVIMMITQGFLTGRIAPKIGEYRAAMLGVASGIAGFMILAFATHTWVAYAAFLASALQGLANPSLSAIMSKQVPPEGQGELQGGLASMLGLSTIIAPILMTQTLGRFSAPDAPIYFPGAAFILASVLAICAIMIVLRASRGPERGPSALPG